MRMARQQYRISNARSAAQNICTGTYGFSKTRHLKKKVLHGQQQYLRLGRSVKAIPVADPRSESTIPLAVRVCQ